MILIPTRDMQTVNTGLTNTLHFKLDILFILKSATNSLAG